MANNRRSRDKEEFDCFESILPSIDGDEKTWRMNVIATMRAFYSRRFLEVQEITMLNAARMDALEMGHKMLEKSINEVHKEVMKRVDDIDRSQLKIISGIDLLKYLVPGVPVILSIAFGALLWFLHVLKMGGI